MSTVKKEESMDDSEKLDAILDSVNGLRQEVAEVQRFRERGPGSLWYLADTYGRAIDPRRVRYF